MSDTAESVEHLVRHFRHVEAERMRDLPIVNSELAVEAIGFTRIDGHDVGVLLSPWFMNLVVLPGTADWDEAGSGSELAWRLPGGELWLTVCHADPLGTFLTGVLFRSVMEFPDQETARKVAREIMRTLTRSPDQEGRKAPSGKAITRRKLLTRLGAD